MRDRMLSHGFVAIALGLAIGLCATAVVAQDEEEGSTTRDVIRFGIVVVHGTAHKPNAFFINTRRSLVYQDLEVRQSFVDEITAPIDRDF